MKSLIGLVIANSDFKICSVNDSATIIFARSIEELVGHHVRELIPQRAWDAIFHRLTESDNCGEDDSIQIELCASDTPSPSSLKSKELFSCHVQTLNGSDGISYIFSIRPNLREEEHPLINLQSLFQQMAENIHEIFWVIDVSGSHPLYVSPAYERVYGYSIASLLDNPKQIFQVTHPDDRNLLAQTIREQRTSDRPCELEYRIFRADGQMRWLWARFCPFFDELNTLTGICGVTADVTSKKFAEKRVSEFHSTISHELRTPLTSIKASLALLEAHFAGELSVRAVKLLQIGLTETERLIRLVNDLLDIKKIEAGQMQLVKTDFHLSELLKQAVSSVASVAGAKNIQIRADYSSTRIVHGDFDKLLQVMINLLSNAIKFSPTHAEVFISLIDCGDNSIRVCTKDRGAGIKDEDLGKLFTMFQQLDQSDSRAHGGTGLGLVISKAIIEEHGGTIGVKTELGQGSEFWFEIPASNSDTQL